MKNNFNIGDKVRIKKNFVNWMKKRYPRDNIPSYAQKLMKHCVEKLSFTITRKSGEDYFNIKNQETQSDWYINKKFLTRRGPFKK